MKRYKLKKDLPTLKAGQRCWLGADENLLTEDENDRVVMLYSANTLAKFPNILTDWFEEMPEEPKTVWDLGVGDDAWFISGGIRKFVSMDEVELTLFQDKVEIGDGFATREEAEKELARRKARQILLRDTKWFKANWEEWCQKKVAVYYEPCEGKLKTIEWAVNVFNDLVFATKEDAEESIKEHKKEWLIYLGVEE